MISKFYKKNIGEGKSFLIFSILFAILVRIVYFFHSKITLETVDTGGHLWTPLASIFQDPIFSIIAGSIMLAIIAFVANYINTGHALIRQRTMLPSAMIILFFSFAPFQIPFSPLYAGALALLFVVNTLFKTYSLGQKQQATYKASFYLSIGSLFAPILLIYFPLLWICLIKLRSFSFKAFLASLFSIFILYIPALAYFLFTENIDTFLQPFASLNDVRWTNLPVITYDMESYIILAISAVLAVIVLIDSSMNSFKDKIRVRAFISVLNILFLFSMACTLLLNLDTRMTLTIALTIASLLAAHFFSLAQKKITSYLFALFLLIYLFICLLPFIEINV